MRQAKILCYLCNNDVHRNAHKLQQFFLICIFKVIMSPASYKDQATVSLYSSMNILKSQCNQLSLAEEEKQDCIRLWLSHDHMYEQTDSLTHTW